VFGPDAIGFPALNTANPGPFITALKQRSEVRSTRGFRVLL